MATIPPKVIAAATLLETVILNLDILINQIPHMAKLSGPKIPSSFVNTVTANLKTVNAVAKAVLKIIVSRTGILPKADIPLTYTSRQQWFNALMKTKNDWVGLCMLAKPYVPSAPDPNAENQFLNAWILKNIKPYI